MKLTPTQLDAITVAVDDQVTSLSAVIATAIEANARLHRQATCSLSITVKREKDNPDVIEVHAQVKSTVPKSDHADHKSWSDTEMVFRVNCTVAAGQQEIGGDQ